MSGGGSCAERRPSVLVGPVLCVERPLCRMVLLLYAEGIGIEGGP